MELIKHLELIVSLHNEACDALNRLFSTHYEHVDPSDIAKISPVVAQAMVDYNIGHQICPREYDTGKLATFTAAKLWEATNEAREQDKSVKLFCAAPLFYGYLHFLDGAYSGNGFSLRELGMLVVFSENLNDFLNRGQWLSCFTFFRGIELTVELFVSGKQPRS